MWYVRSDQDKINYLEADVSAAEEGRNEVMDGVGTKGVDVVGCKITAVLLSSGEIGPVVDYYRGARPLLPLIDATRGR